LGQEWKETGENWFHNAMSFLVLFSCLRFIMALILKGQFSQYATSFHELASVYEGHAILFLLGCIGSVFGSYTVYPVMIRKVSSFKNHPEINLFFSVVFGAGLFVSFAVLVWKYMVHPLSMFLTKDPCSIDDPCCNPRSSYSLVAWLCMAGYNAFSVLSSVLLNVYNSGAVACSCVIVAIGSAGVFVFIKFTDLKNRLETSMALVTECQMIITVRDEDLLGLKRLLQENELAASTLLSGKDEEIAALASLLQDRETTVHALEQEKASLRTSLVAEQAKSNEMEQTIAARERTIAHARSLYDRVAGRVLSIVGKPSASCGYSGDKGQAAFASLYLTHGVAVDARGSLFVADGYNHVIRKVSLDGIITTVAGRAGTSAYGGDNGLATSATFQHPRAVAVDGQGSLYITDQNLIRKVSQDGEIVTVAGTTKAEVPDGLAISTKLQNPQGIAVDESGNIYIADTWNHVVRKVSTDGRIKTVAGIMNQSGYGGDREPATSAKLNNPNDVAIDSNGNIYISDGGNHVIRKLNADGAISLVAGTACLSGYEGDGGFATSARLSCLTGVAIDGNGNVYIADGNNYAIRKVSVDGMISTIVRFDHNSRPSGVAADAFGNVYVSNADNSIYQVFPPSSSLV
jgi:sugar lactone lactonase YvrE